MLYVTNKDKPGFIGRLGTLLGNEQRQHRQLQPRPRGAGEDAIALIEVDEPISDAVLDKVRALEGVVQARRLRF